jgi:DNA modification methylase
MRGKNSSNKEKLNELDGKTWLKYSISVWDIAKTPEEMKFGHPAMFPQELCERLIKIYTKAGDVVLDPFMGSGSVLVTAKKLGRKGIGFEIVPEYVELAKKRLQDVKILAQTVQIKLDAFAQDAKKLEDVQIKKGIEQLDLEPEIYLEDARNLSKYLRPESVDFCLTSPPYWNIHRRERTADRKEPRPYSEMQNDLGNIPDYNMFLNELKSVFQQVYTVLKKRKRCVIVVMDLRVEDKFIPFHIDITQMMQSIGFTLEDIIIWDRRAEYNNLRPLGYPYVFIVNKVHEYILIFRR